ncbi:hypothetical protein EXIGLDRAFT_730997 [Exidia glandulosa HHB12029]|uniref:DUF7729 domain-containing protein n=1 Tax=Exidia glandulosa HHB12029 TaxID=1314781 RepID=A0A165Q0B3_EXIGL|nr:hypothetical protein EXIGLDRAFT_730997 [Exidia glandulosa HHB12029]
MFARTAVAVLSLLLVVAAQDVYELPANISSGCASFLTSLNTDAGLDTCISSITKATKSLNSTSDLSTDQLSATFSNLCASSSACPTTSIRSLLSDFADKCADDLISNQDVSSTYDMLYNLLPMQRAICTKDPSSGAFCALQSTTLGKAELEMPEDDLAQIVMANLDAIGTANTGFLFMTPDTDPSALCSPCFQAVLSSYVDFEDEFPYALGVNLSPLLQGQAALWQSVTDNCGDEVAANVAVKGGVQVDAPSAASPRMSVQSALFGAAALVLAAAF